MGYEDDDLLKRFLTPEGLKRYDEIDKEAKDGLLQLFRGKKDSKEKNDRIDFSFLVPSINAVIHFIDQGNIIINKAKEFAQELGGKEGETINKLIETTEDKKINTQPYRENILQEITEDGSSADKTFVRTFCQIPDNESKTKEFWRRIHKDFLEKYTSNVMLLAEEMRNLSFFVGQRNDKTDKVHSHFSKVVGDLQNQVKILRLDLNYAPLFENYIKYAGFLRLADCEHNDLYKNIEGLKKDDISEIISYGFGNNETKILLS